MNLTSASRDLPQPLAGRLFILDRRADPGQRALWIDVLDLPMPPRPRNSIGRYRPSGVPSATYDKWSRVGQAQGSGRLTELRPPRCSLYEHTRRCPSALQSTDKCLDIRAVGPGCPAATEARERGLNALRKALKVGSLNDEID